jgi:hypothetical protein
MLAFDCVCLMNLWRIFAWGWGKTASPLFSGWKAFLNSRRDKQLGMGVFLILEYQKSFRRPYPAAYPFLQVEDA